MGTNLHCHEMDNVELDPEEERSSNRGLRRRKVNTRIGKVWRLLRAYHARPSLGDYLARVSTVIN